MKEINESLLEKLLTMARLEASHATRADTLAELNQMTAWLRKLQEVDVTGLEPLCSLTQETNKLRADTPTPPLPIDRVLHNAPERSSHYFRIPTVKE